MVKYFGVERDLRSAGHKHPESGGSVPLGSVGIPRQEARA